MEMTITHASTPAGAVAEPTTLGQPPSAEILAQRIRHAIDDALDRYDQARSPEDAKAAAELAFAHRALAA